MKYSFVWKRENTKNERKNNKILEPFYYYLIAVIFSKIALPLISSHVIYFHEKSSRSKKKSDSLDANELFDSMKKHTSQDRRKQNWIMSKCVDVCWSQDSGRYSIWNVEKNKISGGHGTVYHQPK